MLFYYIPKNFLLNLSEDIEIQRPTSIYMNNLFIKYQELQYAVDCVFYPQTNLLSRNIKKIKNYKETNRNGKYFLPYYTNACKTQTNINLNEPTLIRYPSNIFTYRLKEKYKKDIVHTRDGWCLQNIYSTVYFSFCMVYDVLPYNIVLHYAANGAKKIVFDFHNNIFEHLIIDIESLANYFDWNYEKTNDCEVILTNIQNLKLQNYLTWCEDEYMNYFQKLLQIPYQNIPTYESVELYFTKIIDEKEYNNYV